MRKERGRKEKSGGVGLTCISLSSVHLVTHVTRQLFKLLVIQLNRDTRERERKDLSRDQNGPVISDIRTS